MPAPLSPNQLDQMEYPLTDRMEDLKILKERIVQLEMQVADVSTQIHRLREKHDINKTFLAELSDIGGVIGRFSRIGDRGIIADMERSERKLFMELIVLIANNRNAADNEAKALGQHLQSLLTDLEDLKAKRRKIQGKDDDLDAFANQQVNEEENGPREDL